MGKTATAIAVAVALFAAPALAHRSKRTDKCGCHHQYGLVHCHPNQKSNRCEAPVASKVPAAPEKAKQPVKKQQPKVRL